MRLRTALGLICLVVSAAIAPVTPAIAQSTPMPPAVSTISRPPPVSPSSTAATVCTHGAYHYAMQYTATDTASLHDGCITNIYSGWIGVNGQIQTPAAVPALDSGRDHDIGWLGAVFYGSTTSWLQIGWYTGIIGDGVTPGCQVGHCVQRSGNFGIYVESKSPSGAYAVYDLGALSPGQNVTYRVEYRPDAGAGCWEAFYNYSVSGMYSCGQPTSGNMQAVHELYNGSGSAHMGTSWFGTSAAGTNQTLRLKSGSGSYQDWDQTLTTRGTRTSDERGNAAGHNYVGSASKLWWYFTTYQS
jgi:hypothetical protein